MAFSNSKLTTLTATVTSKGTSALKVSSCLPGLLDVIVAEISKSDTLTPRMQAKLATLRTDLSTNAATMQTALGL